MAHSQAIDETKPLGSDQVSGGDEEFRNLKRDIRERMSLEHVWTGDLNNSGKHNFAALAAGLRDIFFPVGAIYYTKVDVNPGTFIGGTWARYAQGEVIVGWKASDPLFGTPGALVGATSVVLGVSEIPPHAHPHNPHAHPITDVVHGHGISDPTHVHPDPGHNHPVFDPTHGHTIQDPTHTHAVHAFTNLVGGAAYSSGANAAAFTSNGTSAAATGIVIDAGPTGVSLGGAATGLLASGTGVTVVGGGSGITTTNNQTSSEANVGGGAGHNNVQPSRIGFVWERTL